MRVMALCSPAKFRVSFIWISATCRFHLGTSAMKNHLPDRWTDYTAVGKRIPGTRFIAFKVPLKKLFDNKLAPWQRFSPSTLVTEIGKQNEELGLVVDLTCTKRYYGPEELPSTVKYAKIFTAGQQVPTDNVIHEFKSTVKQFLSENPDNDKLVGVHCTHGLNRTGYLVCRYMIDVLGMVPSEAIEKFNKSRGHCMERNNYLDDLLQGKPRNNPGLNRSVLPMANHQQHISSLKVVSVPDFQTPLCHQEQLWFPGHPCADLSWRSRISAPPFSQQPERFKQGPQCGFQQMGGRPPRFPFDKPGPRIPPPCFPQPQMPGPRHHIPHMEGHQQQHFRERPQRHRRHHRKHFTQKQEDRPVNGAPMWDPAPHIPQTYGGNRNSNDISVSGPPVHRHNGPYNRWPRKGRQGTAGRQWQ